MHSKALFCLTWYVQMFSYNSGGATSTYIQNWVRKLEIHIFVQGLHLVKIFWIFPPVLRVSFPYLPVVSFPPLKICQCLPIWSLGQVDLCPQLVISHQADRLLQLLQSRELIPLKMSHYWHCCLAGKMTVKKNANAINSTHFCIKLIFINVFIFPKV